MSDKVISLCTIERYHGLDFVRGLMMLMGILLHAGVMYLPMPYGQDPMAILDDPRDPYRDIDGLSLIHI